MDEWLNYFCYGNNEFGVVPDILDIIKDAATFFVTMDMKKLVLDVYVYTFNIFFNSMYTQKYAKMRTAIALTSPFR